VTAATNPLRALLLTFTGVVNRHQSDVIACLTEENRILREPLVSKGRRLTDDQRRWLTAKAKWSPVQRFSQAG